MTDSFRKFRISNVLAARFSIVGFLAVLFAELRFQLPETISFGSAFLLWICLLGTFALLVVTVFDFFNKMGSRIQNGFLRTVLAFIPAIVFSGLPIALIFLLLDVVAPEVDIGGANISPSEFFLLAWMDEYLGVLPTVALLGIIITGLSLIPERADAAVHQNKVGEIRANSGAEAMPKNFEDNALTSRFKELRSMDIWALQADEHYVLVHGDTGRPRQIFYKFKHAMEDLYCSDGLQVHRSWWVSHTGIDRVVMQGRNCRITLKNDIEIPVSSRRISEFKRWLETKNIGFEKLPA